LGQTLPVKPLLEASANIWLAKISLLTPYMKNLASFLSQKELSRAYSLAAGQYRDVYILSHGILRLILSYYSGIHPREIIFHTSPAGKPFISTGTLLFNMSHAPNIVAIAINQADEIGIDIEERISGFSPDEVAAQYFNAEDIASLRKADEDKSLKLFYTYWTRKEAFLKAIGTGFTNHMDHIQVSGMINNFTHQTRQPILTENLHWNILSFYFGNTCTGSIAYSSKIKKVQFYDATRLLT
jgi:4'-phosphopantetheinyl transferase